ncbi:MAG: glycosyltransferase family 2 protein [Acidobacteria bacterium]|nr:glycosyltransferase family 2 protein [Acidobacteriota bacterium]
MRAESPSVFIVVLVYNSREATRQCLLSLRALSYPNYRLVVVDNASSDGSEEMVRSEFPDLAVIQTGANRGYTGGNNRGIEYSLDHGADYVMILNPDTVLANPGFLTDMVAYLEAHPEVGIAGPRVFAGKPGVVQNTVLFAPGLWRSLKHWVLYRLKPDFAQRSGDQLIDAEVLNGVCLLIRAECLRRIGPFDENIFMYIEDAEMDYRAHNHGWSVRYLPVDSIIHLRDSNECHPTGRVNFLLKRNSVYYLCRIGKRVDALGYAVLSLALLLIHAASPFKKESAGDYLQFCRRLAASYFAIFSGRKLGKSFGPPY